MSAPCNACAVGSGAGGGAALGAHPLSAELRPSCSLQLIFPDLVEGLVLMNIDPNGKGWIDWAAAKVGRVLTTPSRPWRLPLPGTGASHSSTVTPCAPSTALWPHQHAAGHCPVPPVQPGKGCASCRPPATGPQSIIPSPGLCPALPAGCCSAAGPAPCPGMGLVKPCLYPPCLIGGLSLDKYVTCARVLPECAA